MQAEELDVALDELENRLDRLRALYEQYFLGIEKIEPAIARKDVDRRIWLLRREKIRNTAKRFKLQTIIQRYNTFQQYWQRVLREIEAGTYRRHVIRAEKQFGTAALTIAARKRAGAFRRGEEAAEARALTQAAGESAASGPPPVSAPSPLPDKPVVPTPPVPIASARPVLGRLDLDLDFGAPVPATTSPAPAPAPAAPRPAPPPLPPRRPGAPAAAQGPGPASTGLSDQRVRELHARLIAAKRETNDGSSVSIDGLARSLREAESRLKAQHSGRSVDFDVVIKGGKALVKPVLK